VGLHARVKLSRGSPTLKKRSLTCNRLRNPTIAGHGNLAEIRLESTSFDRVKQCHVSCQLCSQLDQRSRYCREWLAYIRVSGDTEGIDKRRNNEFSKFIYGSAARFWTSTHTHIASIATKKCWLSIGEALNTTVTAVQRKIRYLRNQFCVYCCNYCTVFM